ncbi:hypothetical protein A3Q56_06894 [Intoshia linei]|uniref:Uncharacterized protein n=1 Tax=Intoshia linei TaxID=1819745 RepID=A0A177ATQ8_9BILA|nr:hypothetical protein A3Q56_06894 [Intoshia linei]
MYSHNIKDRITIFDQIQYNKSIHNKRVKRNFEKHIQKSKSYFTENFSLISQRKSKQESIYKLRNRNDCRKPSRFLIGK